VVCVFAGVSSEGELVEDAHPRVNVASVRMSVRERMMRAFFMEELLYLFWFRVDVSSRGLSPRREGL
jgi:hypothetical protein